MNCAKCGTQREKCAHACVRWSVICICWSPSWQMPLSGREICSRKKKHGWWMRKTAMGLRTQVDFGNSRNSFRPHKFPWASLSMNLLLSVLAIVPPLILPFFWLPPSPLLRIFPVLRAPPCWAFCPCRRWRWWEMLLPVETQPTWSVVGL